VEDDLRTRLLATSGVSSRTQVVVWGERPQGSSLPAVVLNDVNPGRSYGFFGPVQLHGSTVQFDIWSLKYGEGLAIFRAILAEMEQAKSVDDTRFSMSFLERKDSSAESIPGVGTVRRISADFTVWWKAI